MNQSTNFNRRQFSRLSIGAASVGLMALAGCSKEESSTKNNNGTEQKRPEIDIRSSKLPSEANATATKANGEQLTGIFKAVSESMYGFTVGNTESKNVIHIVFDPMCPHCGNTWKKTQAMWNDTKFVWYPVPLMGPRSFNYGSMIISSSNPIDAMNAHEDRLLNKQPLMQLTEIIIQAGSQAMRNNENVARKLNIDGVPFILHQRNTGEVVSTVGGIEIPEMKKLIG